MPKRSKRTPQRDPLKADFRNFLYALWHHLGLGDPTPLQYDIAYELQHGPRRLLILGFRGVAKSWITAAYVLWRLYCDVDARILVVSATATRAKAFTQFCLQIIRTWDVLQHLTPDETKGNRSSMLEFDVNGSAPAQAPSVKADGIFGQITGSRATDIVGDDIEIPRNSETQAKREKLAAASSEFDAIILPQGRIKYLGTYQTEESVYKGLPLRGYAVRVWPARVPDEEQQTKYGDTLAPYVRRLLEDGAVIGSSTEPSRFTDEDLAERELSWGRSGFALQFMLDPSLSSANLYPLKLSDLVVMSLPLDKGPRNVVWGRSPDREIRELPVVGLSGDRYYGPTYVSDKEWQPWQGTLLSIDPAGRGEDELAANITSYLNGLIFLRKSVGLLGGYSNENLQLLAVLAKEYGVNWCIYESNFGDGMFGALLTPVLQAIHPVTVEEVRASTMKEKRIVDTLEPIFNQHRLVVDLRVIQEDFESVNGRPVESAHDYRLFYQITRMRREKGAVKHDDRADSLAQAVSWWTERLNVDHQKQVAKQRDEAILREVEEHMAYVRGEAGTGMLGKARRPVRSGGIAGSMFDN